MVGRLGGKLGPAVPQAEDFLPNNSAGATRKATWRQGRATRARGVLGAGYVRRQEQRAVVPKAVAAGLVPPGSVGPPVTLANGGLAWHNGAGQLIDLRVQSARK